MYDELFDEMKKNNYEMRIISVEHLKDLEEETDSLIQSGRLENGISRFLQGFYDFHKPDTSINVKSILVVAAPSSQAKVRFRYQGNIIPVIIPPTYRDFIEKPKEIELLLNNILRKDNFRVERAPSLPEKLLAVRSGLSRYGRNNITYVPGMGSFLLLSAYYSDLPCEESIWRESSVIKACEKCTRCIEVCPTGAINADRFLINAERCITYQNEFNTDANFPSWINETSHNCLIGCMKCQLHCPMNNQFLTNIIEAEEFNEEETNDILEKKTMESLPVALVSKLERLNLIVYYQVLARNLKVLLEQYIREKQALDYHK